MADSLEAYSSTMQLPVQTGRVVERLARTAEGDGYVVTAGGRRFAAAQVVVATGPERTPKRPDFAGQLDPAIRQMHSSEYRNPAQLQPGPVLVVGAGNSGADIALELARAHHVILSGKNPGTIPFRIESWRARLLLPLLWLVANHVLTLDTPIGRKMSPYVRSHGGPLVRVKPADLLAAGVERVLARTVGVRDGRPVLADGRVVEAANVIWCTGFRLDFGWIDLPIFDADGWPAQDRGVVPAAPGLYFLGLPFQRSFGSMLIGGVGRDAAFIAKRVAARARAERRHPAGRAAEPAR
jgi:putative flavoprotein involved in K+ transport